MQRVDLKGWLFHSSFFCFCIPVRAGFVLITILSFLLSGTISVIIWFEVSNSYQLTTKQRVAFILTGVVESFLFLASVIGFIGVVARKQLFVMIYTYFLYVHLVINTIVGIYFLVTVRASNRQQLVDYCSQVFVNTSLESSCARLVNVSTYVFIAIVAVLLWLELYGVLIATRYVYRLRKQKRDGRSRRLGYFHALSQPETPSTGHVCHESDDIELLHSSASDAQGLEDAVLDIRPRNYMPVSTYDRDLPPGPAVDSQHSPSHSTSDMTSSRRVRALPPRPTITLPVVVQTSNRPREEAVWPERLPNPHETSSRGRGPRRTDSEDDNALYTAEVSTTAHSAMMDHATYMETVFSRPNPSL